MLKFSSIIYLTLIYSVESTLCRRNHNPSSARAYGKAGIRNPESGTGAGNGMELELEPEPEAKK